MIRGIVENRRATVNLMMYLSNQQKLSIEFEIDTAFQGALAIPPDAVAALGLEFITKTPTIPANGIPFQANLHETVIEWDDKVFVVPVLAMGLRPLIGTVLLDDHDLYIAYTEGGEVLIKRRSNTS